MSQKNSSFSETEQTSWLFGEMARQAGEELLLHKTCPLTNSPAIKNITKVKWMTALRPVSFKFAL